MLAVIILFSVYYFYMLLTITRFFLLAVRRFLRVTLCVQLALILTLSLQQQIHIVFPIVIIEGSI